MEAVPQGLGSDRPVVVLHVEMSFALWPVLAPPAEPSGTACERPAKARCTTRCAR